MPPSAVPRSIASLLGADHARLDGLFDRALGGEVAAWGDFTTGLRRHIGVEEEVLFPAYLRQGGPPGPVQVMRMEHLRIEALLRRLPEPAAAAQLKLELDLHNQKEEGVLYPMSDRLLASGMPEVLQRIALELARRA